MCILALLSSGMTQAALEDKTPPTESKLAPLSRFLGEWSIDGRWTSGEELHARAIYEWGINRKFIRAKTFVKNGDSEYQRYDGLLGWHAKKKSLFEVSFAFNGEVSEFLIEPKDADTLLIGWTPYEPGRESRVRQTIKFRDQDTFIWTVELKDGGSWKQLMEGAWKRKR
jgi:hypothetical protein